MAINYNQALYAGISFPPRKDGNAGFFATSVNVDVLRDSIYVLLNTRKGEMPMNPEFGSSAIDLLFDNITPNSQTVIAQHIKEDIEAWEPRVSIDSVSVYSKDTERIIVLALTEKVSGQSLAFNYNFAA